MNSQISATSPQTILRLAEVRQRTGLSRSSIYKRIEAGEFPHQISLGARAVGWLKREVEDWINRRIQLRPGPAVEFSEESPEVQPAISERVHNRSLKTRRPNEPISCTISVDDGSPDPANLHLVGTQLYFDKSTGDFWIKLLPEPVSKGGKQSRNHRF